MDVIGIVTLIALVLLYAVIESSGQRARKDLNIRLTRLEGKIDLLMKHEGVPESASAPAATDGIRYVSHDGTGLQRRDEILALARAGKKIEAIKIYREVTGVGLREAKDAVERLT